MRLVHTFLFFFILSVIPAHSIQESVIPPTFDPERDTIKVATINIATDYSSKVPGKSTFMNAHGDTLFTIYYSREGKPLAKFSAISKKTGGWKKYYYNSDGTYYEEYRPPRRKKEGNDYMRYGVYPVEKTPELSDPLMHGTVYHDGADCLDKYGNWGFGWIENGHGKEPIIRCLEYHGTMLPKKEYQDVVNWGANLMGTVVEIGQDGDGGDNPLGVELVPVMTEVKKWMLYFLWAFGVLLVFFYRRVYSWFNFKAKEDITPYDGRFGKEQLVGVIPALMIAAPYVLYYKSMGEREAFYTLCFFLGAIAVCAVFILLSPKDHIWGRRTAFWKQVFATVTVASAFSLIVPSIVLFVVFCFLAGGASSSSSSSRSGSSDEKREPDHAYPGGHHLNRIGDGYYMDDDGNTYGHDGNGGYTRIHTSGSWFPTEEDGKTIYDHNQ